MLYTTLYFNVSLATVTLQDLNSFSFADQIQINFFSLLKEYIVLKYLAAIRLIVTMRNPWVAPWSTQAFILAMLLK